DRTVSTFYDYPSFLKELNFTNLLATFNKYESFTKINAILRMLTKRGVRLESFIIDNIDAKNDRLYGSWVAAEYASILSSLVFVRIHTPFQKNNVVKSLTKNCTKLSHLDINLYVDRVENLLSSLQELISVQTCPLSLRLMFAKRPGKRLVEILRSHRERFKHLELVKWDFN
ncbi:7743_t:CDS:2, partial [Paraglomus occultum]